MTWSRVSSAAAFLGLAFSASNSRSRVAALPDRSARLRGSCASDRWSCPTSRAACMHPAPCPQAKRHVGLRLVDELLGRKSLFRHLRGLLRSSLRSIDPDREIRAPRYCHPGELVPPHSLRRGNCGYSRGRITEGDAVSSVGPYRYGNYALFDTEMSISFSDWRF